MKIYFTYGTEAAPEGFESRHPENPWNLDPDSVEEVSAPCILEKVSSLPDFMAKLYTVMKPEAKVIFTSGYYGCSSSFVSPLVKRSLSEYSMNWCSKDWREQNKFTEIDTSINFQVGAGLATDASLNLRADEVQQLWRSTRLNCVLQVHFTLTKVA